jgi:hypothetical protein
MPGLGATDPANLKAQACEELGFSRQLKQPRHILQYPGLGDGGGYNVWYRKQQLQRFDAGEAIDVSLASIYQWKIAWSRYIRLAIGRERLTLP